MKVLHKTGIVRPTASITNDDSLLQKKLDKNSVKIRQAQEDLQKGNGDIKKINQRIAKLQTKEAYLISIRDLKTRFMIETPEDYNENTDIEAEKVKIYTKMQKTVDELQVSLEKNMHTTEGLTIPIATQILGENIGTLKALADIVKTELKLMTSKGGGLQGYYALERDLLAQIQKTQDVQKSLIQDIGASSTNNELGIIEHNMILSGDQTDAMQVLCKSTKQRLSTLHALLDMSIHVSEPKIDENNEVTEAGAVIGESIKNSLRELLNAGNLQSSQSKNNEELMETMPFLQDIDISKIFLTLEREGEERAKESIESILGEYGTEVLGEKIVGYREVEKEVEVEEDEEENRKEIDKKGTEGEGKKTILKIVQEPITQTVCTPFKNCVSTDDVINVISKLSGLTMDDGTPAVDMHNVFSLFVQSIKTNINVSRRDGYDPVAIKGYTYYKMGERTDDVSRGESPRTALEFVNTKGREVNTYKHGERNAVLKVRDAYLESIVQATDSFNELIKSIDSGLELNTILKTESDNKIEEKQDEANKEEQVALKIQAKGKVDEVDGAKSIEKRSVKTVEMYFKDYIAKMTNAFKNNESRSSIIKNFGTPHSNEMFIKFLKSDEVNNYMRQNIKELMKEGFPIVLDWIQTLPEDIIDSKRKENILTAAVVATGIGIQDISKEIQRHIIETQTNGDTQSETIEEFEKRKASYREKIGLLPQFIALDEAKREELLTGLVIQNDIRAIWEPIIKRENKGGVHKV